MPEDQDKTQKTKATLIKHEKADEVKQTDSSHVKKKRVVVSSSGTAPKKVVVKRRTPKIVAKKNPVTESSDSTNQESKVKAADKPVVDNKDTKTTFETNGNSGQKSGGYQGSGQRQGGYQGGGQRQGGYQGGGQRQGGYQGGGQRQGGYQGGGQRQGGYQGGGQRQGGYQGGGGQRPGGYQGGGGQRPGGYQGGGGQRPGGYQGGGGQRPGGYQGGGQRPGGYQGGGGQRPGGYQGGGQRPGGYQGGGGQRPGGYQGGGQRQGGYQGGGGQRPGGYQGGGGQRSGGSTTPSTDQKKASSKKFFKSKKNTQYNKKKNTHSEKSYEYKKKVVNNTNPVPKEIAMMEVITVSELARKMNLKASDLISKLMKMGMMVTINQQIDFETASLLAEEYKCKVKLVSLYDETLIETEKDKDDDLESRPPIVTVMGHVDHGKTKLLDAIRQTNVVDDEFGGITQHIGAYTVKTEKGDITFLDTPGHAAFTLMRARGAQITDVVVLVVAANDGVMPQTIEAINHAKEAEVPIIVAVNKVDLPEANIDRVKQQLSEYNLISEDWGGSTQFIELSALKRLGIDKLLDSISLEAELLELKANFKCKAEGKIIESKVDQGRGIVSSVLIERGTLKIGDSFVAGIFPGKVRAMFNDRGHKVEMADPSMPVEILGLSGIPDSGDPFQVTENEKIARMFGLKRQELKKHEEAKNVKKITLANLYDSIQDGEVQELKVIIKGDVHGSVEALKQTLEKLSTPEIRLVCIHSSAGAIIENDVSLAAASNAIIVGFHVRPTPKAQMRADQEKVEIKKYNIIYDAVEDIRSAMEGMLTPDLKEEIVGQVEVRETFKVPKIGTIAGCMVKSGFVTRKSQIHMYREGIEIFTGPISALKRFKDDAKEVKEGFECGISLENFSDIKVGDVFEVFEMKEIAKKLGDPIDK